MDTFMRAHARALTDKKPDKGFCQRGHLCQDSLISDMQHDYGMTS